MRIVLADVLLDRIEHLMERATTNVAMMLGLGLPGAAEAFGRQVILFKIFGEMVVDLAFDDPDIEEGYEFPRQEDDEDEEDDA